MSGRPIGIYKQKGHPEMNAKKEKVILSVIFPLILLIAAAVVWFFEFNPTGYRMSVSHRASFENISDNVYINRYYSGSRDEISHLIDEAKSRVAAFYGSLTCPDHTVIIICDDEKLLAKLGGPAAEICLATAFLAFFKSCLFRQLYTFMLSSLKFRAAIQ